MATRPAQKLAAKQEAAEKEIGDTMEKRSSAVPSNVPRPQDHKSAKTDVVDDQDPVTFNYEGEDYTLLPDAYQTAQDVDWLEKLQDGNLIGPIRDLLGYETWVRLKEQLRPENGPFTVDLLRPFFELMMKELRAKNS